MQSYKVTDFPPIVSRQHTNYDDTIANKNCCSDRRFIMIRAYPTALTAAYLALTTLATWLLCETDALSSAAPLFFH